MVANSSAEALQAKVDRHLERPAVGDGVASDTSTWVSTWYLMQVGRVGREEGGLSLAHVRGEDCLEGEVLVVVSQAVGDVAEGGDHVAMSTWMVT